MSSDFQMIHDDGDVFHGSFSSQLDLNHDLDDDLNDDLDDDLDDRLTPCHVMEMNQLIEQKVDQVYSDYNVN